MGRHRTRCAPGFTLLEVLVALALVGVLAGMALVRSGGAGMLNADRELDRLRAVVALAGEQAVLRGEELGIGFWTGGYRFFVRAGSSWHPLAEPRAYRVHRLGEGLTLELRMEGGRMAVKARSPQAPQVVLWSSGELTPFEVILGGPGGPRILTARADGSLVAGAGAAGRR